MVKFSYTIAKPAQMNRAIASGIALRAEVKPIIFLKAPCCGAFKNMICPNLNAYSYSNNLLHKS